MQFVPSNWTMQLERTDCLIRGNELQSERTSCPIRGNELLIRGNKLLNRENGLHNSVKRFTYGFFWKSPCPFRAFEEWLLKNNYLSFKSFIKNLATIVESDRTITIYLLPVTSTCPVVHMVYKLSCCLQHSNELIK